MQQTLLLNPKGLKTNPNPLQPDMNGQSIAENIVIDRPYIASSRRGIASFAGPIADHADARMFPYDDSIVIFHGNTVSSMTISGVVSDYPGTFNVPDADIGFRATQINDNLYFTDSTGVKKLTSLDNVIQDVGAPRGLGADSVLSGVAGWFNPNTQIAYRAVWGITDENDNVILGYPSDRIEVINATSGTTNVSLQVQIPNDATTNHYMQLYRSQESASSLDPATDELYLVYEGFPTVDDISNGYVQVLDITPASLVGATIYTAPSQEGIAAANSKPPLCKDITSYKGMTMYANYTGKHSIKVDLLAVSGDVGLYFDDVITIDGMAFSGGVTTNNSGMFAIEETLTPAENISTTAKNLIKAVNLYTDNTDIEAYYVSAYDDLPGQMVFERTSLTDSPIYMTIDNAAHSQAFNPPLPQTNSDSAKSAAVKRPHGILVSKYQQPESVPVVNEILCGDGSSPIIRAIGLRDAVFVFLENGDIWRVAGEDFESMAARQFDNGTTILAPRSLVMMNGMIFGFSDQGVVSIGDSGLEVISFQDIENLLNPLRTVDARPLVKRNCYAVAYDSDRKFMLCYDNTWYVLNFFTRAWTTWTMNFIEAVINPADEKLYAVDSDGYIYQERKAGDEYDFADDSHDLYITSVTDNTIKVAAADLLTEVDDEDVTQYTQSVKQGLISSPISAVSDLWSTQYPESAYWFWLRMMDEDSLATPEINNAAVTNITFTGVKDFDEALQFGNGVKVDANTTLSFDNTQVAGNPVTISVWLKPTVAYSALPGGIHTIWTTQTTSGTFLTLTYNTNFSSFFFDYSDAGGTTTGSLSLPSTHVANALINVAVVIGVLGVTLIVNGVKTYSSTIQSVWFQDTYIFGGSQFECYINNISVAAQAYSTDEGFSRDYIDIYTSEYKKINQLTLDPNVVMSESHTSVDTHLTLDSYDGATFPAIKWEDSDDSSTIYGQPGFTTGKFGQAMHFTNISGYVDTAGHEITGTGAMEVTWSPDFSWTVVSGEIPVLTMTDGLSNYPVFLNYVPATAIANTSGVVIWDKLDTNPAQVGTRTETGTITYDDGKYGLGLLPDTTGTIEYLNVPFNQIGAPINFGFWVTPNFSGNARWNKMMIMDSGPIQIYFKDRNFYADMNVYDIGNPSDTQIVSAKVFGSFTVGDHVFIGVTVIGYNGVTSSLPPEVHITIYNPSKSSLAYDVKNRLATSAYILDAAATETVRVGKALDNTMPFDGVIDNFVILDAKLPQHPTLAVYAPGWSGIYSQEIPTYVVYGAAGYFQFTFNGESVVSTTPTFHVGDHVHMACSWDESAASLLRIYMNNVDITTGAQPASITAPGVLGMVFGRNATDTSAASYERFTLYNTAETSFDIDGGLPIADSPAYLYDPIRCEMQWIPLYGSNPAMMKRFQEILVAFDDMNDDFTIECYNNFDTINIHTDIITSLIQGAGYGEQRYGEGQYGGAATSKQIRRVWLPQRLQRCLWLNLSVITNRAFTNFSLSGLSILFEQDGNRFKDTPNG